MKTELSISHDPKAFGGGFGKRARTLRGIEHFVRLCTADKDNLHHWIRIL